MNFRFKALAQLREPDELDAPVVLASPRGWMTIGCLTVVVAAALLWALVGRLPQTITGTGLITRPQGTVQVQSLYQGMVSKLRAPIGGYVTAGQVLAVISDPGGAAHKIVSPYSGQVISVGVTDGQVVPVGGQVATIERSPARGGDLVAMLFVPSQQAAGIVPGEQVGLAVASAPTAAFGLLRGRVESVSQFPLTAGEVSAVLGGTASAGISPAPRLVIVRLIRNPRTMSGYAWTTAAGPPQELPSQVPATGTINVGSQAPISLLFSR